MMKIRINYKMKKGFSLIELLVVMSLIVALTTFAAPTIIQMFQGWGISQAYNTLYGAFNEAQSLAITSREDTGVFMYFRSDLSDSKVIKVWVVSGRSNDVDGSSSALADLTLDEIANKSATDYDDQIVSTYELPENIILNSMLSTYSSWYVVFRPDGTAMMLFSQSPYLPEFYDGSGGVEDDVDITNNAVRSSLTAFENDPANNYDFRLSDGTENIYVHLQPTTGKLIKRSDDD
jgi:prepilin-type N-terminal cleavage/methylation domain-containing protein